MIRIGFRGFICCCVCVVSASAQQVPTDVTQPPEPSSRAGATPPAAAPGDSAAPKPLMPGSAATGKSEDGSKRVQMALPSTCGAGYWKLPDAEVTPAEGVNPAYSEEWSPLLNEVEKCLLEPDLKRACVRIRGHYDEIAFDAPIVRAFGTMELAQKARARGRGASVKAKLEELGVPTNRLQEVLPLSRETFRGAEVTLVMDCLPATEEEFPVIARTGGEPGVTVVTTDANALARSAAREAVAQYEASLPSPQASPHELWLQPSVTLSFGHAHKQASLASLFGMGVGWTNQFVYLHAEARLGVGVPQSHRTPFEGAGGVGLHVLDWLDVGLSGGYQFTTKNLYEPWYQRAWFIGGEATECLWSWLEGSEFCLYQAVYPIGSQEQRVELIDGEAYQSSSTTSYFFRADAGVSMRFNML